jgi:hypothetical protein
MPKTSIIFWYKIVPGCETQQTLFSLTPIHGVSWKGIK